MKITLSFLSAAVLLLAAQAAFAQENPVRVAVYNFTPTDKASAQYAPKIDALVTANLASHPNIALIERAELSKAVAEQAFGLSGMVNSKAAAQVGQITGANVLVAGQIFTNDDRLMVIADIIGTDTSRLFAETAEGKPGDLPKIAADLSDKIAAKITAELTNLIAVGESREDRIERIVKSVSSTNRPFISMSIKWPRGQVCNPAETELGLILQRAGFSVVDAKSDHKPDLILTGMVDCDVASHKKMMTSCRAILEIRVRKRVDGAIVAFEHKEDTANELGRQLAVQSAIIAASDDIAEKILPALAR